jgi:hypothetical protein
MKNISFPGRRMTKSYKNRLAILLMTIVKEIIMLLRTFFESLSFRVYKHMLRVRFRNIRWFTNIVALLAVIVPEVVLAQSGPASRSQEVCSLLTQTEVSAALGAEVGHGENSPYTKLECVWTTTGTTLATQKRLRLFISTQRAFIIGRTPIPKIPKKTVKGLGDDAYYSTLGDSSMVTLSVKKGTFYFNVTITGKDFSEGTTASFKNVLAAEEKLAADVLPRV